MKCPATLSLLDAPDETIAFFNGVSHLDSKRVFIDASMVEKMTPDGLLVLLIALKRCRAHVRGNFPKKAGPKDLVLRSGFRDHVHVKGAPWTNSAAAGFIERRGRTADGKLAAQAVTFACNQLGISRKETRACYTILMECMANTRNHAAGPSQTTASEDWYLQVHHDAERQVVCFCFADLGKGIIETLNLDPSSKIRAIVSRVLPIEGHSGILKRVLAGEIKSSTKKPSRGLGLPKIAALRQARRLERLVIIANRAYIDFDGDRRSTSRETLQEFCGTLLYWEIGRRDSSHSQLKLAFDHA